MFISNYIFLKEVMKLKKSIIFPSVLILVVILFFSTLEIFEAYGKRDGSSIDEDIVLEMQGKVEKYLLNKGYKDNEIFELEVKFDPKVGNVPDAYYVNVIFDDEKEMTYKYTQINDAIVQVGFSGPYDNGKHVEVE